MNLLLGLNLYIIHERDLFEKLQRNTTIRYCSQVPRLFQPFRAIRLKFLTTISLNSLPETVFRILLTGCLVLLILLLDGRAKSHRVLVSDH